MQNLATLSGKLAEIRRGMDSVIVGQEKVKEQVLVCLVAGGHALLEGVPGVGKTLLSLTLAKLLGCRFRRIQFTPDLMPTDLLGTNVFSQKSQEFEFHGGPVFTDLLLADEVNRTPPKTQSALLEAMQEQAVTIDGVRRHISPIFFVIATQNPVEFEGTYPLPEAQRDRFLLKISVDFPTSANELSMLEAYASGKRLHETSVNALQQVMTGEELLAARALLSNGIRIDKTLLDYIVRLIANTRNNESVQIGAGPRASLALMETSRALALLRGRDFVTPDDIKEMAGPVLIHRVTISPEAEMEGVTLEDVLRQSFEKVEVPR